MIRTDADAIEQCRAVLHEKSKSFALASRLLPKESRDPIAVLYAFCRYVDDAIDLADRKSRPAALRMVRTQVEAIYSGEHLDDPTLQAFAAIVSAHKLPHLYIDELIAGMEMDVWRTRYQTLDDLFLYSHRVAGVVGLLLCHVMGVRDESALRNAAHLGIAMQFTNICRDVDEDLRDGRMYLPEAMLGGPISELPAIGTPERRALLGAVERLLDEADRFYRSAEFGLAALPLRCALAVRAASLLYAGIGEKLRARGCDPFLGRAVVPTWKKLWLALRALAYAPRWLLASALRPRQLPHGYRPPTRTLLFPRNVLPLEERP